MGSELAHDEKRIFARNLEIPAGGGVGTARALAHAYSVFATEGKELGLHPETLQELMAPAIPATHGFFDECIKGGYSHTIIHQARSSQVNRIKYSLKIFLF